MTDENIDIPLEKQPQVATPTYLLVPRKLIVAWIVSVVGIMAMILGAVVWSNHQWCGIIAIFNETYESSPPPTPTGQRLASEFERIHNNFLCR